MNPFLSASTERRAHWKTFRQGLIGLDLPSKARLVGDYWGRAPLAPQTAYDLHDASQWPTPWEMLHRNHWCRNSVAIGMESTLRLAEVAAERMTLQLITDHLCGRLLVLLIDENTVLNYDWGLVHASLPSQHQVIRQWRFVDRGYRLL